MERVQGRPLPLGITVETDRVNFSVVVSKEKPCELLLYRRGKSEVQESFAMPAEDGLGEIRFLALKDLNPEVYEYNFLIGEDIVSDSYAKVLTGKGDFGCQKQKNTHSIRGGFVTEYFEWEGDKALRIPYHEVIAYSLHVRGFTKHSSSKVKNKGTFAGVAEKIPYLKELGINQIQCMPIYDFEEWTGARQNYWGYGPGHYYAPKASYSASGNPVRELKELVKLCHKAGIEVVLEMPFAEGILPREVVDCLQYYMLEYHVDGFVVNPYYASWESLIRDPLLKGVKLMKKEDWYQNVMRRFLKGDEGMVSEVIWAFRHNTKEDGCCNYITSHTGFTLYDLVSYDGKHNEVNGEKNQDGPEYNYSWNCGIEGDTRKKAVVSLRRNQVRNAMFLLLTSQGTPCLLAGDEFGNSQKGNNNVYCQDNELSWLNWNHLMHKDPLFPFVKALIALRKVHPVLHRETSLLGLDQISSGIPDVSYHGESAWQIPADISSRQLGVLYCGDYEDDADCFLAYNMHWENHKFAMPALNKHKKWYQIMDTVEGLLEEPRLLDSQRILEVNARNIVCLIGK